jgi:hypothetical protein
VHGWYRAKAGPPKAILNSLRSGQKFKAAVARNDKASVADMTKLPFMLDSKEVDRAGFIKQYSSLFTPKIRRCFASAKPSRDQDSMEIFCGEQIFLFAKVNGVYKFTDIGVND